MEKQSITKEKNTATVRTPEQNKDSAMPKRAKGIPDVQDRVSVIKKNNETIRKETVSAAKEKKPNREPQKKMNHAPSTAPALNTVPEERTANGLSQEAVTNTEQSVLESASSSAKPDEEMQKEENKQKDTVREEEGNEQKNNKDEAKKNPIQQKTIHLSQRLFLGTLLPGVAIALLLAGGMYYGYTLVARTFATIEESNAIRSLEQIVARARLNRVRFDEVKAAIEAKTNPEPLKEDTLIAPW